MDQIRNDLEGQGNGVSENIVQPSIDWEGVFTHGIDPQRLNHPVYLWLKSSYGTFGNWGPLQIAIAEVAINPGSFNMARGYNILERGSPFGIDDVKDLQKYGLLTPYYGQDGAINPGVIEYLLLWDRILEGFGRISINIFGPEDPRDISDNNFELLRKTFAKISEKGFALHLRTPKNINFTTLDRMSKVWRLVCQIYYNLLDSEDTEIKDKITYGNPEPRSLNKPIKGLRISAVTTEGIYVNPAIRMPFPSTWIESIRPRLVSKLVTGALDSLGDKVFPGKHNVRVLELDDLTRGLEFFDTAQKLLLGIKPFK